MFGKKKAPVKSERELRLIDQNAPFNFVEAYKALRTNIEFICQTNNYNSILVTSAGPWDGKTTVAINLAVALGNNRKKVLLVDCDLRKGTIASYLKIGRKAPGISNVLFDKVPLNEAIHSIKGIKIDVLPVGAIPSSPTELIGSKSMVKLIQVLSQNYDYVIIDTPPVSLVTDAAILSRYVDGVLLVTRAEETTKQALSLSKKNLTDVNANIIGVVLNDFNAKLHTYGQGSYYYSNYRYNSYGEGEE